MGKLLKFDPLARDKRQAQPKCEHRNVTVYTANRTVRCSYCQKLLDPFEVLVDMVKGYIPPSSGQDDIRRMAREEARRKELSRVDNSKRPEDRCPD